MPPCILFYCMNFAKASGRAFLHSLNGEALWYDMIMNNVKLLSSDSIQVHRTEQDFYELCVLGGFVLGQSSLPISYTKSETELFLHIANSIVDMFNTWNLKPGKTFTFLLELDPDQFTKICQNMMNFSMNLRKFHAKTETGNKPHFTRCQFSFRPAHRLSSRLY